MLAPARTATLNGLANVCRLGLATRGGTHLDEDSILKAIDHGVNYLNWCGHPDGLSQAVRQLGTRRSEVFVAVQFEARSSKQAHEELRSLLAELNTNYLDVVTYYYVEEAAEWDEIRAPGGAAEVLQEAKRQGTVRAIGVTSHQRPLMASIARTGQVDLFMLRYNAAHRGAEQELFPIARQRQLGVIAFTALRWGALLQATPDDPPDFRVPSAPEWYRFVLCHPDVTVALMAPDNSAELAENLALLADWRGLDAPRYQAMQRHGERVRRHGGQFP